MLPSFTLWNVYVTRYYVWHTIYFFVVQLSFLVFQPSAENLFASFIIITYFEMDIFCGPFFLGPEKRTLMITGETLTSLVTVKTWNMILKGMNIVIKQEKKKALHVTQNRQQILMEDTQTAQSKSISWILRKMWNFLTKSLAQST